MSGMPYVSENREQRAFKNTMSRNEKRKKSLALALLDKWVQLMFYFYTFQVNDLHYYNFTEQCSGTAVPE